MNDVIISIEHISKSFHINDDLQKNFREILMSYLTFRRFRSKKDNPESFCALQNVSFEMKRGESIGILGRNGAGKSTLLKIIAGITPPSEGIIRIQGKLASILDIGTGFHPDLSGRDNIYLSASLLGMKKSEIKSKFDKIVAFSGISEFINTPVKHYSSGMYVRLAFAIASHVNADILLFDEIISVGDAEFKMKCLEKVNELKNKGVTILLVSHSFNDIMKFCDQAILMADGKIANMGDPQRIIIEYVETILKQSSAGISRGGKETIDKTYAAPAVNDKESIAKQVKQWGESDPPPGNDYIRILKISVSPAGKPINTLITTDDDIGLEVCYRQMIDNTCLDIAFVLLDESMNRIFAGSPVLTKSVLSTVETGYYSSVCTIPKHFLNQGLFSLDIIAVLDRQEIIFENQNLFHFRVRLSDEMKNETLIRIPGPVRPHLQWVVSPMRQGNPTEQNN